MESSSFRFCVSLLLLTMSITISSLYSISLVNSYRNEIISLDKIVISSLNDKFLSFALDSSFIAGEMQKLSTQDWIRIENLTKLLVPAYLRFGGNSADQIIFGNDHRKLIKKRLNLSPNDLIKLIRFANTSKFEFIFDFNALLRVNEKWDSTNAEEILSFLKFHNFSCGFQLGNEPNSYEHKYNTIIQPQQLGSDYEALRSILNSSNFFSSSVLVGPEITRPKDYEFPSQKYLDEFLNTGVKSVDAVTWHQYYLNGRTAALEDFLSPLVMSELESQIKKIVEIVRKHSISIPIWLSETGDCYGGGAFGLSDSYPSLFLLLDKLGVAAKMNISIVMRQSLLQGHYALIDKLLNPSPSYWFSLFYKNLVGNSVYLVKQVGDNDKLRLYAHSAKEIECLYNPKKNVSVVIYGMNLSNENLKIIFKNDQLTLCAEYIFTNEQGSLQSKNILINGKKISWPIRKDFLKDFASLSGSMSLSEYSLGFWTFADVNNAEKRNL